MWKNGHLPELKQRPFPASPWHIRTLYFAPFLTKFTSLKSQKEPKKFKKLYFGQISNSSLIFYPLPILGLSFEFYYVAYPVIIKVTLAKI